MLQNFTITSEQFRVSNVCQSKISSRSGAWTSVLPLRSSFLWASGTSDWQQRMNCVPVASCRGTIQWTELFGCLDFCRFCLHTCSFGRFLPPRWYSMVTVSVARSDWWPLGTYRLSRRGRPEVKWGSGKICLVCPAAACWSDEDLEETDGKWRLGPCSSDVSVMRCRELCCPLQADVMWKTHNLQILSELLYHQVQMEVSDWGTGVNLFTFVHGECEKGQMFQLKL